MKTIILAAGTSSRLRPLTNEIPKCLLKLDGQKTILERLIEKLIMANLTDINIISGHGHALLSIEVDKIISKTKTNISIIFNEHFNDMNNCYSLLLGLRNVSEDALIINSDVVFEPQILDEIPVQEKSAMLIDIRDSFDKEDMKVIVDKKCIVDIGKELPINKSFGEFIGISRISGRDILDVVRALEDIVNIDSSLYYEDAYRRILRDINFQIVSTNKKRWMEIDDFKDMELAKGDSRVW